MSTIKDTFHYLSLLEKNNDRDWFKENKEEFDSLKAQWIVDVQHIINLMAIYDPSLRGLDAKNCVYRIYRDIRFSPNKLPFKTYFSAVIGVGGRKCLRSCYYLHLQPGDRSGLYGGVWCPEPKILATLRHSIDDNFEEFQEIIGEACFKDRYEFIGDRLKTTPKGFAKDAKSIEFIRFKEYTIEHKLPDSFFSDPDWREKIVEEFRHMLPLHNFLNYAIDEE